MKLPTGDAAIAKMIAKNTETLVVNMAVEMAELKKRIRVLEMDSHPPINLEAAIKDILKDHGIKL